MFDSNEFDRLDEDLEDEECDEEEQEEEDIDWYDYCDYAFAMEVVNGSIINLSGALQEEMRTRIISETSSTEEELLDYLQMEDSESASETDLGMWLWNNDVESPEILSELLGFNDSDGFFHCDGIGFLNSDYGWAARKLLEALGYPLSENINFGPHGHGTTGVVYLESVELEGNSSF